MEKGLRALALASPGSALHGLCELGVVNDVCEFQFLHYKLGIIRPVIIWYFLRMKDSDKYKMDNSAWHMVNAQEIISFVGITVVAIVFSSPFERTHFKRDKPTVPYPDETLKSESLSHEE